MKYNDIVIKAQDARKRAFAFKAVPLYLLGVYAAANLSTDKSPIIDLEIGGDKDQQWLWFDIINKQINTKHFKY